MDLIAYLLHRRTPQGARDSVAPVTLRDLIHLNNATATAKADEPSGDAAADEFRRMLSEAR